MSTIQKKIRLAATAVCGVLALGSAALAADDAQQPGAATSRAAGDVARGGAYPRMALPQHGLSGQRAVDSLGRNLDAVARFHGRSATELRRALLSDKRLKLDRQGQLFFMEMAEGQAPATGAAATPKTAASPRLAPLDQTFKLHSKPGASKTLYLNFQGATLVNTDLNVGARPLVAAPFTVDNNTASLTTAEMERIQITWQRVAEDFAPFDMDVTTEPPPPDRLLRANDADQVFGATVLITSTSDLVPCNGCYGLAYLNGIGSSRRNTALVYSSTILSFDARVAETISHEAGHLLGLSHDGTPAQGYYWGHGFRNNTTWAPIMGVGFYRKLVQWSKGEYPNANNKEDDFAVMQRWVAYSPDDVGDTPAAALPLPVTTNGTRSAGAFDGLLGRSGERDVFAINAGVGSIRIDAVPTSVSPNADLSLQLINASGTVMASNSMMDSLNSSIQYYIFKPGTYFIAVKGAGEGNPQGDGYSDYGSAGRYRVTASFSSSSSTPPVAVLTAEPSTGTAPLSVKLDASASSDDGQVKFTYWSFGDGKSDFTGSLRSVTRTYTKPGTYTATVYVVDDSGNMTTRNQTIKVTAAEATLPKSLAAR